MFVLLLIACGGGPELDRPHDPPHWPASNHEAGDLGPGTVPPSGNDPYANPPVAPVADPVAPELAPGPSEPVDPTKPAAPAPAPAPVEAAP